MNMKLFGLVLVILGALVMLGNRLPFLGRLPGDIYYSGRHIRAFLPLGTGFLLSIIATILLTVFSRLFK